MRIETFRLQGFRSVQDATLIDVGGFNVLIGKNNSGKSNMLMALHGLFKSISPRDLVAIESPLSSELSFSQFGEGRSLRVSAAFLLGERDLSGLIEEIVAGAPQVRNAFQSPPLALRLGVHLLAARDPHPYACIDRLDLLEMKGDDERWPYRVWKKLLEVPNDPRRELVIRAASTRREEEDREAIGKLIESTRRFPTREWQRFSRVGWRELAGYRGISISEANDRQIRDLLEASESASEFQDSLRSLQAAIEERIQSERTRPLERRIETISGEEEQVPDYATWALSQVVSQRVLYLTERRRPIGPKEASQLLELKVSRGGPEKLRDIQTTVEALLGVEIDAFRSNRTHRFSETQAELDVDRFLVQVNGAGIREALRLILDYEFAQPDVLLVEEPEIHLHPALEVSMMRYLKRVAKETQIFVTTHSTNFVDTAEMRNVYLTDRRVDGTSVRLIDVEEAEEAIPKELGLRLSSVFMFDRIVFVEGVSDEEILRELASKLKINFARANVTFIPMNGIRNISHYAAERTMAFLSKRRVDLVFVIDRDERTAQEVNALIEAMGDRSEVVALQRREIENYLLHPRGVAEFINLKRRMASIEADVSEEEVGAALGEEAEGLREAAILRRVVRRVGQPIYFQRRELQRAESAEVVMQELQLECERLRGELDRRMEGLAKIVAEEREAISAVEARRLGSVVPGDLLLDAVAQRFGVRFKKTRDATRLAELLLVEEIPEELLEIVRRLGVP